MSEHDGIDYDALLVAALDANCPMTCLETVVHAVVAALRDQGLVVVRAEVFRGIVNAVDVPRPVFPPYLEEAKATLAAPSDGDSTR
jgi:hypothetical protein